MTMIFSNPRERSRFYRFAVVGFVGAVVDFGIANLLRLFGASLVLAGTISFIAAIINNFLWNRYWTYPDSRSKPILRQLIEFSVVSVMGLVIRVPILALVGPRLYDFLTGLHISLPGLPLHTLSDNLTLALAVVVVMFWNFFVNRFWTYGDVD